ncbi:MAG: terminase [Armatimonadetes bacterium]|nr:terminase [Armatimonadota bacterium]
MTSQMTPELRGKLEMEAHRRGLIIGGEFLDAPLENPSAIWTPQAGAQSEAYNSPADVLGYGGAGGGGKSDLLLGLAGTRHYNSVIFRRIFPSTRALIERSREIFNASGAGHNKDSYNESLHIWRLLDGRMVELASMQHEKDKEAHRGRPRDLYGFDEATEFTESQVRFVTAWNRSARWCVLIDGKEVLVPDGEPYLHEGEWLQPINQRCRVVLTFNPPTTIEGRWIMDFFGPWLNDKHPRPAVAGELRWFIVVGGKDVEVPNGEPIENPKPIDEHDRWIYPRSRTFIPALLSDNPLLEKTGYRATLQGLPEPLRSQMLYGDFRAGMKDSAWQVIPTAWVDAAIERGKAKPASDVPLTALGVDPSRGGDDFTIAPRYGNWFGPIQVHTRETVGGEIDGPVGAKLVMDKHHEGATINVDAIGIGSSVYDSLKDLPNLTVHAINAAAAAKEFDARGNEVPMTDKTGRFKLTNIRTATLWKLREALDPESGEGICLPDDDELRADLTAPTYRVTAAGYVVEPKHGPGSISERLGRSPGKGDAVALAHWQAPAKPAFQLISVSV